MELKTTFECELQQDLVLFNYTCPCMLPLLSTLDTIISTAKSIKIPNFTLNVMEGTKP